MEIKNQHGQTMVEYILLLSVVVSVVYTFMNSNAFKRIFGTSGAFASIAKIQGEQSYRYSSLNQDVTNLPRDNRNGAIHHSYHDEKRGGTRFFGPKAIYP